jgi:hypothetical protein
MLFQALPDNVMQLAEIGLAVLSTPNRFPIHDDGADPKGSQRQGGVSFSY